MHSPCLNQKESLVCGIQPGLALLSKVSWMPKATTAPAELPLLRNSKSSQQELGPEEEEFRDNSQSDGVRLEGH